MKSRSIFEKFLPGNGSRDECSGAREFVAEQLEARVLYSGAPALVPQVEIAHEAASPAVTADFESIDTFISAAQNEADSANEAPLDKVVILSSFEEVGIEVPVRFETLPASVKRWDSGPSTELQATGLPPVDFIIVKLDDIGKSASVETVTDGVFVEEFQAQNRLTAIRSTENEAVFGLEHVMPGKVLGLGQIAQSMNDQVEWVAFAA